MAALKDAEDKLNRARPCHEAAGPQGLWSRHRVLISQAESKVEGERTRVQGAGADCASGVPLLRFLASVFLTSFGTNLAGERHL